MESVKLNFFLPMQIPTVTDQEHRIGKSKTGKVYVYRQQNLANARSKFEAHLAPYVPDKPIDSAARLIVIWRFPLAGKHYDGEYKTTKPDTDNLIKMFKDVMADLGFFTNDAVVADERSIKQYAAVPGVAVFLETL